MKQDAIALERALTAAVGPDAALFAELRAVFLESANRLSLELIRADGEAAWRDAAWRLKGTAASFGATGLMTAAEAAAAARARDPAALAALGRALAELTA